MSESNTPILNLNAEQLAELTRLRNAEQYPAMYLYLKAQVDLALQSEQSTSARHADLGTLSNWLDNAAAINADTQGNQHLQLSGYTTITTLPNIASMGNVRSLQHAHSRSVNPTKWN